jgi:hypothetical protein
MFMWGFISSLPQPAWEKGFDDDDDIFAQHVGNIVNYLVFLFKSMIDVS